MIVRLGTADPALAESLGLPLESTPEILLERSGGRLQLRDTREGAPGPLTVDFSSNDAARRRDAGLQLPLARAVGVKRGVHPTVLDATPGLGRDAYVLESLGCEVVCVERSPVFAALLRDGLERAGSGIELIVGDSVRYMRDAAGRHEVVYLDPMFPERRKSAAVKKEMQYMQALMAEDDAEGLLNAALKFAKTRVVMKRPVHAPVLQKPNHSFDGKTIRFDVYVV